MNQTASALPRFATQDWPRAMRTYPVDTLDADPGAGSTSRRHKGAEPSSGMVHPQLPAGLRIGDAIAGKYRIEAVLGVGAMGTVVSAHHLLLAQLVAIKFLNPERVDRNPEARARFIREARAAIRVKNEHVARVLDIAALETGELYIVMEYLEGSDLQAWMRKHGPMPHEEAVNCVLQACEALAEAHALGIVHRDIKPANLFLVKRRAGAHPLVKVLDFGISKTTDLVPATADAEDGVQPGAVTGASAIMGSPFYMSPEQMESARDVDGRTDIWALGILLCELVTGSVPFEGTTLLEVYRRMISSVTPPLPTSPARAPPALEEVIRKCIERRPENRYANIRDLAVALEPLASGRGALSVERIRQNHPPQEALARDVANAPAAEEPAAEEPIDDLELTLESRVLVPPTARSRASTPLHAPRPPPSVREAPLPEAKEPPPSRARFGAVLVAATAALVFAAVGWGEGRRAAASRDAVAPAIAFSTAVAPLVAAPAGALGVLSGGRADAAPATAASSPSSEASSLDTPPPVALGPKARVTPPARPQAPAAPPAPSAEAPAPAPSAAPSATPPSHTDSDELDELLRRRE
jgi:serine/threonine protein kinase